MAYTLNKSVKPVVGGGGGGGGLNVLSPRITWTKHLLNQSVSIRP